MKQLWSSGVKRLHYEMLKNPTLSAGLVNMKKTGASPPKIGGTKTKHTDTGTVLFRLLGPKVPDKLAGYLSPSHWEKRRNYVAEVTTVTTAARAYHVQQGKSSI